jgi:predicted lipid-binding transport protein (Tim44 family)
VKAILYRIAAEISMRAGGGHGGGHSSGGGGHSGGSSGYGGGGYYGGYHSGAGGALAALILFLLFGGGGLLIVILFLIFHHRGGMSPPVPSEPTGPRGELLPGTGAGAGMVSTQEQVEAGVAQIREHDPAFDEAGFLALAERAFFTIQQAWSERKPDLSRQVMADGIWQQHRFQIEQYITQGRQNMLDNLAVQNTKIVAAHTDQAYDTVMVRFFASCADYDIDLNHKNKVVRGNKRDEDWSEDWCFQRSSQAVTKQDGGTMSKHCPNCGAPLDVDLAGVCKYCKAPVMSGQYDWVLTRIEQLPDYEYALATS